MTNPFRFGWHQQALRAIQQLTIAQQYLTADDLHEALENLEIEEPKDLHAWGTVFDSAAHIGIIVTTGRFVRSRRKAAKGRNLQLWQSIHHRATPPDSDPVAVYLQQSQSPAQTSLL